MNEVRIAKEFKWEMSHRLPFHEGPCRNIHGHTYKLRVALQGAPDDTGMLLDYYEIEKIFRPMLDKLDHSFLCDRSDGEMIEFLKKQGLKYNVMDKYTTAENISDWMIAELADKFRAFGNISHLAIRLYETEDTYAEREIAL